MEEQKIKKGHSTMTLVTASAVSAMVGFVAGSNVILNTIRKKCSDETIHRMVDELSHAKSSFKTKEDIVETSTGVTDELTTEDADEFMETIAPDKADVIDADADDNPDDESGLSSNVERALGYCKSIKELLLKSEYTDEVQNLINNMISDLIQRKDLDIDKILYKLVDIHSELSEPYDPDIIDVVQSVVDDPE